MWLSTPKTSLTTAFVFCTFSRALFLSFTLCSRNITKSGCISSHSYTLHQSRQVKFVFHWIFVWTISVFCFFSLGLPTEKTQRQLCMHGHAALHAASLFDDLNKQSTKCLLYLIQSRRVVILLC